MRFCDNCGSYMKLTAEGFVCPRCGKLVPQKPEAEMQEVKKSAIGGIYVIDRPVNHHATVYVVCPTCGHGEAFHTVSVVSGEHAGTRRERTIEHFRCTKCSHSWSKSA